MSEFRPFYFGIGEQRWLFDESQLTLQDYFVIKNATGLGRLAFLNGIIDEEPASLQALVWWLRRKDEPALTLAAVSFRPSEMSVSAVPEPVDVPEPPDPPVEVAPVGPSTSTTGETSTSTSSPAGSASEPATSTP